MSFRLIKVCRTLQKSCSMMSNSAFASKKKQDGIQFSARGSSEIAHNSGDGGAKRQKKEEAQVTDSATDARQDMPEEDEFGNNKYNRRNIPPVQYEYLDHTSDVQLHAWGDNLREAFEQVAIAMFGYMTEIDAVEMSEEKTVIAEGDDLNGLLFHFLDEWLYVFSSDPYFIPRRIEIEEFHREGENYVVRSKGFGEAFDLNKHPQGTEVKAITYSNIQVHDKPGRADIFVIVDI